MFLMLVILVLDFFNSSALVVGFESTDAHFYICTTISNFRYCSLKKFLRVVCLLWKYNPRGQSLMPVLWNIKWGGLSGWLKPFYPYVQLLA